MSKLKDYFDVVDRSLNRWENAFEEARAGDYPPERFIANVAQSWADWAFLSALPLSVFGVHVTLRPAVPTIEFIVTDKTKKMPKVVELPDFYTGPAAGGILTLRGLGQPPQITPGQAYGATGLTLAGDYLYVTLDVPTIATLGLGADLYQGDVLDASNHTIARVRVVWPG